MYAGHDLCDCLAIHTLGLPASVIVEEVKEIHMEEPKPVCMTGLTMEQIRLMISAELSTAIPNKEVSVPAF